MGGGGGREKSGVRVQNSEWDAGAKGMVALEIRDWVLGVWSR